MGKSTSSYASADFVTDARTAMTLLRPQKPVAAHRVGLLGHGEGATVALLTAAASGRAPAFVVSLAGYGQLGNEVLRRQQGEIMPWAPRVRAVGRSPANPRTREPAAPTPH